MLQKFINYFTIFTYLFLSQITKFIKINFLVGAKTIFFSLSNIFMPLIGKYTNSRSLVAIFSLQAIIILLTKNIAISATDSIFTTIAYLLTVYHFPTFCGALFLCSNNRLLKIAIPLISVAIFVTHPVGSQAFWYSFYWFIPAAITIFAPTSFFLQAIGSTFTMHAVGSILWLYTHNLDAQSWANLVSIVWAERLLMAVGMTAAYGVVEKLRRHEIKNLFVIGQTKSDEAHRA